jgi:chromosome segregation ATPase
MDETTVLRAQARAEAVAAALDKARADAAAHLSKKRPEIEARLAEVEQQLGELFCQRDKQRLAALAAFMREAEGQVGELPRKGVGGVIRVPALNGLEKDEAAELFASLQKSAGEQRPASDQVKEKIATLNAELRRLSILTRYPGVMGIDSLVG